VHRRVDKLLGACVRVGGGTGFLIERGEVRIILTAEHVVRDQSSVPVRWRGGITTLRVLHADRDRDLAVVEDAPGLSTVKALTISEHVAHVGQDVAFAGYPSGWAELTPVFQRGTIAATADQLWLDGSANRGNSGGPVVTWEDPSDLRVIGVVLGRAGSVSAALRDFGARANQIKQWAANFQSGHLVGSDEGVWVDPAGSALRLAAAGMVDLAKLLDEHFRTGLVRLAGVEAIRHALGPE
jgi:S1-C subfamily serine protease